MKLKKYIQEQIDIIPDSPGLPPNMGVKFSEDVYKRLINFVTGLKPDQLTQEQNEKLANLITLFDMVVDGQEET